MANFWRLLEFQKRLVEAKLILEIGLLLGSLVSWIIFLFLLSLYVDRDVLCGIKV